MPSTATTRLAIVFAVLIVCSAQAEERLAFEQHVQPILRKKCLKCHSTKARKGELDLSSGTALLKGGESGQVIIPGKPDDSPLLEMVVDGAMPPKDSGIAPLTAAEKDTLKQWIIDGALFRSAKRVRQQVTDQEIVPLMLLRCTACHGHRRKEAGLDLRSKASMLKGGKSGPAVIPGKPDQSLIIKRIESEQMPPRRLLVSVSVKTVTDEELTRLKKWIRDGLPESKLKPDVANGGQDPLVSAADRNFWSFQSPRKVIPPAISDSRIHNPIDAFVLRKLQQHKLSFSAEADRATLIRRLNFDLLGLPPTPEEVARFIGDRSPRAYEALVDRLLASPRHGERWARFWLDAAGYADSEGAQNEDRVRAHIWRYRDYVVRAFNADKPYDRFLHEQIAGDELAPYEKEKVISGEVYDNLVATGFLRTAPDRTFADITNFVPERLEVISDEIQIFGSAVLGLTLHCARCHSHKFDPIPQRDYYRLAAVFKDALDEHDWLKSQGPRTLPFVSTSERQVFDAHNKKLADRAAALRNQAKTEKDEKRKKQLEAEAKQVESRKLPQPRIRALWSRGTPSPTHILKRGNYLTPGREVGPGVPSVLTKGNTPFQYASPWNGAGKTGRRLGLARWLTRKDNPLTARVMVNRIWNHHFGRGIVRTLGNFGKMGAKPTHPELLDWLAIRFAEDGWSIKRIHRLIVTSRTYRQSSDLNETLLSKDPENDLFSRMPMKRIEGEAVRDSLLFVSGQLNTRPFGKPDDIDVRGDGLVTSKKAGAGWRRSIFVLQRRTKIPTILENFDFPQMGPNCLVRSESIVAPQALHLLNNALVHEWASRFADRVKRDAGTETGSRVKRAWWLAFGREPSENEMQAATESVQAFIHTWRSTSKNTAVSDQEASDRALVNFCHALMNSSGFIYVD